MIPRVLTVPLVAVLLLLAAVTQANAASYDASMPSSSYHWVGAGWSSCSKDCGGGVQTQSYSCICDNGWTDPSGSNCPGSAPPTSRPCNTQACPVQVTYQWVGQGWGACNAQCGGGTQTQNYLCVGSDGSLNFAGTACTAPKPPTSQSCNTQACNTPSYHWEAGSWCDCSASCGGGVQTRNVICVCDPGMIDVTGVNCALQSKPATTQACNTQACPVQVTYQWVSQGWQPCSKPCGGGVTHQNYVCVGSDGSTGTDDKCGPKPTGDTPCNTQACVTYQWNTGQWSGCSLPCGGGVQTRTVVCLGSDGSYSASACAGASPPSTQPCNTQTCVVWSWIVGEWGGCSVPCGGGIQTATLTCKGSDGSVDVTRASCAGLPQPATSQPCNLQVCVTYSWQPGSFGPCDKQCGGGTQTRPVVCLGSDGSVNVDGSHCGGTPPPSTSQACNTQACVTYSWVAGAYGACNAACGGGTHTRSVTCVGSDGSVSVDGSKCVGQSPPASSEACNTQACPVVITYSWVLSPWSACNCNCGGGQQTRTATCVGSDGSIDYTGIGCSAQTKPATSQPCNTHSCPPAVTCAWNTGDYCDCSKSCGGGIRTRSISCHCSDGTDDATGAKCTGPKPDTQVACNTQPCVTYSWSQGGFGACSVTCGGGTQTQTVTCVGSDGSVDWTGGQCSANSKPATSQSCNTQACPVAVTCSWNAGVYCDCSKNCGGGVKTRPVTCQCSDGTTDSTGAQCTAPKPDTQTSCNTQPCVTYSWSQGGFGACSVTCGGGTQTQTVHCVGSDGTVDYSGGNCDASTKPPTSQACNSQACPVQVTCSWNSGVYCDCSASCGGGVRTRPVTCQCSDGTIDNTGAACSGSAPASQEACNTQACPQPVTYHWSQGGFGACSVTCGGGTQTQTVHCVGSDGSIDYSGGNCDASTKPPTSQSCNSQACPVQISCQWLTGDWCDCTASCGGGITQRMVQCRCSDGTIDATGAQCSGTQPASQQSCNTQACSSPPPTGGFNITFSWQTGAYGACSAQCGGGTSTRDVTCVGLDGTTDLTGAMCTDTKPASSTSCNTQPCVTYSWHVGSYGACSVQCGGGTTTRTVTCVASDGSNADNSKCDANSMPSSSSSCNPQPCQINVTYTWQINNFGACSVTCGGGVQTRTVFCLGSDGSLDTSNSKCSGAIPATSQTCNTQACPVYYWFASGWSACSQPCGGGIQTQTVSCLAAGGLVDNSGALCASSTRPATSMICNTQPCLVYSWTAAAYGSCSVQCGGGVMTRTVTCTGSDNSVDATGAKCAGMTMPISSLPCNTNACVSYYWTTTGFSACSTQCGGGVQTQTVLCVGTDGTIDNTQAKCDYNSKPATAQACNTHLCNLPPPSGSTVIYSWQIGAYTACSAPCGGGVMTRNVTCVGSDGSVDVTFRACGGLTVMPPTSLTCNVHSCVSYFWATTAFGACSAPCGGGISTRNVTCVGTDGSVDLTGALCGGLGLAPVSFLSCNTQACQYIWVASPWQSCSAFCSGGIQTRFVGCFSATGLNYASTDNLEYSDANAALYNQITIRPVVADSFCNAAIKPLSSQACNTHQCTLTFSPWSVCSHECGTGNQTRTQFCYDAQSGLYLDASFCQAQAGNAVLTQACNTQPCQQVVSYGWQIGAWSACDKLCGGGNQHRLVTCVDSTGATVDDTKCASAGAKPLLTQTCNTQFCSWSVGVWSQCTNQCSGGTQTRSIRCVDFSGLILDDTSCDTTTKPASSQVCGNLCYWSVGAFGQCSGSCDNNGNGQGTMTRGVVCYDGFGNTLNNTLCDVASMPPAEVPCSVGPCVTYEWKVTNVSTCIKTQTFGCYASDGTQASNEYCQLFQMPEATVPCDCEAPAPAPIILPPVTLNNNSLCAVYASQFFGVGLDCLQTGFLTALTQRLLNGFPASAGLTIDGLLHAENLYINSNQTILDWYNSLDQQEKSLLFYGLYQHLGSALGCDNSTLAFDALPYLNLTVTADYAPLYNALTTAITSNNDTLSFLESQLLNVATSFGLNYADALQFLSSFFGLAYIPLPSSSTGVQVVSPSSTAAPPASSTGTLFTSSSTGVEVVTPSSSSTASVPVVEIPAPPSSSSTGVQVVVPSSSTGLVQSSTGAIQSSTAVVAPPVTSSSTGVQVVAPSSSTGLPQSSTGVIQSSTGVQVVVPSSSSTGVIQSSTAVVAPSSTGLVQSSTGASQSSTAVAPPTTPAAQTFTVTVAPKTQADPYYGMGFAATFVLNGVQGMTISATVGQPLTFQMSNVPDIHQFYISTDPAGAGNAPLTEGVAGNGVLTWTPAAPGTYYYQCMNHQYMGGVIMVTDATTGHSPQSVGNKRLLSRVHRRSL